MLENETAIKIKANALEAVRLLLEALAVSEGHCSPEMFEKIRRGVGLSIGNIDMELLLPTVYNTYPELDDVAKAADVEATGTPETIH